jgi:hypothetical protein
MIRIRFTSDQDRIKGSYLLTTNTVVRSLRGGIFEIAEADRKLLDEHQIHYAILPIPHPTNSDEEVRNTPAIKL